MVDDTANDPDILDDQLWALMQDERHKLLKTIRINRGALFSYYAEDIGWDESESNRFRRHKMHLRRRPGVKSGDDFITASNHLSPGGSTKALPRRLARTSSAKLDPSLLNASHSLIDLRPCCASPRLGPFFIPAVTAMSFAYPPRFLKYLFSSTKERDAAKTSILKPGFYGEFPRSFGLYYECLGDDFLSLHFYISDLIEAAGQPRDDLYAISYHKGPGMKQMTLYSTAEHGSLPLAIATTEKRYGNAISVKLPGTDSGPPRGAIIHRNGLVGSVYSFSIDGINSSSGRAKAGRGLVLLCPGDEVVATWKEGSVPNREYRLASFRFEDEEAAQKMGEYGNLLVVCAFLAVCQQGGAIECTMTWQEEKSLERSNYLPKVTSK
ncbi:hypothetical protein AC579_5786 [Pseudocercospora musae]|uniref:Uncharacterized protein n=1 Tax=Pseudocercospora musae TaxID=113226 RepID=A0A139IRA9_9PEZI|nr:hypothetical protein AC579_5786 [Pseudocercospora musae]